MIGESSVHIKKLVYGGYGLGEIGGRKLLVDYSVPGEVVKVEVLKDKGDYALATVKDVVFPSEERREAPCPYYGRCGGCQLQHIRYDAQLRAKAEILLETLRRIGRLEIRDLDSVVYGEEFGYRVRAQFKVQGSKLGFFERRSHRLVEIEKCLLLHPSINRLIPSLRELSNRAPNISEIHVSYSPTEDEFLIKLISKDFLAKEKLRKIMENTLPKEVKGLGFYRKSQREYYLGRDFTFYSIGPYRYRVSMDSFFQINYLLWEDFINTAMPSNHYNTALELHCGVGFFSLFLAKKSGFVHSYDSSPSAIRDAEYNARINSVDNLFFYNEKSLYALKRHAGEVIDLIFLDPPRSGLSEGEAKLITANRPKEMVYVSCEPTTFARDLKVLTRGGYNLRHVSLIDNFPNTYHIESVARLSLD
ncbi:MAG: 23S rRNA (uracil(1939)-C(5))-methyltransferase RlmD [Acidobacteria bacterium]|jgi:23S rRNA (uracil1939-C5)-methyltransferase|nr:MAG: 23S rRNA (uracil(1939)-C(5))-methyltransferase RlmD [Acidobacteriota bacterium]